MKNAIYKNYRVTFVLLLGLAISGFEMTADLRRSSANVPFESPIQSDVQEQPSQTFMVTTTFDGAGAGTFRTAINNANANPGLDTIAFNIPGSGFQNLQLATSPPTITDPVIIDGSTQPGYAGEPLIRFLQNGGASFTQVINITGGNSTVRAVSFFAFAGITTGNGLIRLASNGNVVVGCAGSFGNTHVVIDGGSNNRIGGSVPADRNAFFGNGSQVDVVLIKGAAATGNRIIGNWFGTTFAGAISRNSGNNIVIDNAPNNFVGGSTGTTPGGACTGECNLISGGGEGVRISGAAATGNTVIGNYFGTDVNGTTANRNDTSIRLVNAPNNRIGGGTPAARNVMGAAFFVHLFAEAGSNGTIITGNYIGVKPDGASAFTGSFIAAQEGLRLLSNNNRVGGVTAGERNVISGSQYNIHIVGGFNQIFGNYIGTNAAGTAGLTTTRDGILLEGPDNTIGTAEGTAPLICTGGCNLISGNGPTAANNGILILGPTATRNVIAYNYIGLNATGTAAIHNGLPTFGHSILIISASGNTIGSPTSGASQPTPISMRPEVAVCIEDDDGKFFMTYETTSLAYSAKDCETGKTFKAPPLATVSSIPPGITFFSAPPVQAHIGSIGASGSNGAREKPEFRGFHDSNINDNGVCECPQVGGQFFVGWLDMGFGSNRNKVMNNYKGISSNLETPLSFPGEGGIDVTDGIGNRFMDNYVVGGLGKPAYALTPGNPVIGGYLFTDTSIPPITITGGPQINVPILTAEDLDGVVRVTGIFAGRALTEHKFTFYGIDPLDVGLTAYRDSRIEIEGTTDASGNLVIDETFEGYLSRTLLESNGITATATEFGEVFRPGEHNSPAVIGPISTSVMSPPITVVVQVSGRVTTPGGLGLRNAVVTITDSLGVRQTATTSSFGVYTFNNIRPGENYVIGVSSKRYRFAARTVQVNDSLSDVDFVGLE